MGVGGQRHAVAASPHPHHPRKRDTVPIVQKAEWAPGPVWTGAEYLAPGFDPRTAQRVASGYTDWASRSRIYMNDYMKLNMQIKTLEIKNWYRCTSRYTVYVHLHWHKVKKEGGVRWSLC
jgi:hypothetical protein